MEGVSSRKQAAGVNVQQRSIVVLILRETGKETMTHCDLESLTPLLYLLYTHTSNI